MAEYEVSWSSFLREPTSVESQLERGDVILRRRDGAPLRLSRASSDAAWREALLAGVRVLTQLASHAGTEADASEIAQRLPWTRFLSAVDRKHFVTELLETLEACADLGDFAAAGRLVEDWKATAALHAEGLGDRLKRPIHEVGKKVRRP